MCHTGEQICTLFANPVERYDLAVAAFAAWRVDISHTASVGYG